MLKNQKMAVIGCILLAGCGQPQPQAPAATPSVAVAGQSQTPAPSEPPAPATGAAMEVKLPDGQDLSFDPTCGFFDPRGDVKSGTISVANYEFQMESMAANSVAAISKEGQIRVSVGLKSLPDGNFQKPITTGEYSGTNLSFVEVFSFENGAQKHSTFDNESGKVTITEVTDSQMSGSFDVSGDKGAHLKGSFTARRTQKS